MDDFGGAAGRASKAGEGHTLSLGRIERALSSYVGHAVGANRVTEQLSTAFGSFALGGTVVSGVLLGVGAVIAVYEKLTEGTRKAKEENDKFSKSLLDQAEAQRQASIAGRQEAVNRANDLLLAAKQETGAGLFSQLLQGMAPGGQSMGALTSGDAAAHAKRVADATTVAQEAVNNLGLAIAHLNGGLTATGTVAGASTDKVKEMTFGFNELRNAADKVNADMVKDEKDWWRGYIDRTNAAIQRTQELANQVNAIVGATVQSGLTINHDQIVDLTKPTVDSAKAINDAAEKARQDAADLKQAIWGSALAGANTIVSALNIGGGGRNSNLGGALGSTAGFAAGFMIGGPVGGAVGSTIGNVLGSLVGGLFDHKKAVESNTDAVRANTQALLLNAPSGFKVASARYDATQVRQFRDSVRRYDRRGGTPTFGTT